MASIEKEIDASGAVVYKIQASGGRGRRVKRSWRPEPGWSAKTIERELNKFAAQLENELGSGALNTKREDKEAVRLESPDDESKCWVDHIDGNRSNNDVSNLRWVTPSENATSYGYHSRIKNKRRKVRATHLDGRTILFESRQAAAEYFGCSDSEIKYNSRYRKRKKKGWIFEKVEDIV